MLLYKSNKTLAIVMAALVHSAGALHAAPLPDGALLAVDAAGNIDATGKCQTGSCFGSEVSPGFWIWTSLSPGNDGGFVVGKNQLSGGQELGPSTTNDTPGDVTGVWFFYGAYGSSRVDNTVNTFSDTSNDGATLLNDLNLAWNGRLMPLDNGAVNDYSITLDGNGGGSYSLDYSAVIPDGQFAGVKFWWISRGNITLPPPNYSPPPVEDINLVAISGEVANWTPSYTDDGTGGTHTCAIETAALVGIATVNSDCSSGSYTSANGYVGIDTFSYSVTNQFGLFGTGNVSVVVELPQGPFECDLPVRSVTTTGGGQSPAVNTTLTTTFTGLIVTDAGLITGGKNTVKICKGTMVDFESASTVGSATCQINNAVTASFGTLTEGDKLICSNKPDGSDVDRFSIKSGI